MPGWDFARAQNNVNPHIMHMFPGTFFVWRGPMNLSYMYDYEEIIRWHIQESECTSKGYHY